MHDQLSSSEPIFRLPPYRVESVFVSLSQLVDWNLALLNIPSFWGQTRGQGVKVCVLDTGIATQHPDLQDAVLDARDFTDSRSGIADVQGHSTHVSGIIAARDNTSGVVGVAPEAKLLIGKVLGDNGSGSSAGVAAGIHWAVEQKADIINMSLGSPQPDQRIAEAIQRALDAGIYCVAASGNEGPSLDTVGWPAAYEGVISVGAIDRQRKVAKFSSRGRRVDLVCPGDRITSCYPPRGLATLSGSSMAAPFCSGVVALILAKHRLAGGTTPVKTPKQMIEHLRRTAIDIDAPGFDFNAGFGLINPEDLLADSTPPVPPTIADLLFTPDDLTPAGRAKLAAFRSAKSITLKLE